MAAWPTLDQLKTQLGVTDDSRDDLLTQGLAAAVEQVCTDIGYTDVTVAVVGGVPSAIGDFADDDEDDVAITPKAKISQAALILAVMAVKAPDAPHGIAAVFDTGGLRVAAHHPTYMQLLTGSRRSFGIG